MTPIKILHLSDIHLGSSFSHGRINPATGVNTRLEDFSNSLRLCIDQAIGDEVDLVLFGGDAFPDATPPPYIQEAFARQFQRLATAQIPTVLLVGNHDQHAQGSGGASLSIYRTLAVPGFVVGDSLKTHLLTTKNGEIQIITLPWLNHSALLTRPESQGKALAEVNQLLIERLTVALEGEIRQLNPEIPTVLLGHLMVDRANLGAERFLAVGKGFTVPLSLLTRSELDYVALGHVHKHQNLNPNNDPPVIYPGSIERVDFSEEKEAKGFVSVELSKGHAVWGFSPLPARLFLTINLDVCDSSDPQSAILEAIDSHNIEDAIVRLIYKTRSEQLEQVNSAALHQALKSAHSYTIRPELDSQLARPRLPELGVGKSLDPLEALTTYLDSREDLKDISQQMLVAAEQLIQDNQENLPLKY